MSICGSSNDEHDIITLHYAEEGLLTVGENRESPAAAFGDDVAMKCLATEFQREIYVSGLLFGTFISSASLECTLTILKLVCAGGDHYEPLIAHPCSLFSKEKVALVF
ncbi:unnamed protein product [Thlaspi arvense]|uniref:Uncharacterized protein n=1 Tax=Thlaspi arvense TaxID=13288 RepID=A0AAU9S2Y1_THLAR|nr:unnamed protein product [Thlaspi arvense]